MTTSQNVIELKPTNRFFKQLITAQAATAAYIVGHVIQAGGNLPRYMVGNHISQICYTRPQELEFEPSEVLDPISKHGNWPTLTHLWIRAGSGRPPASLSPNPIQLLMGSLYEHAFIAYFAKSEDDIVNAHGSDRQRWPSVLNFGRVVRNAFAHGGVINIEGTLGASWAGLSYSAADNGRRVIYNDLSAADLTLLMLEMDTAF